MVGHAAIGTDQLGLSAVATEKVADDAITMPKLSQAVRDAIASGGGSGNGSGPVNFNQLIGTLALSQIPDALITDPKIVAVSASKLTGTIDDARIPTGIARGTEVPTFTRVADRAAAEAMPDDDGVFYWWPE